MTKLVNMIDLKSAMMADYDRWNVVLETMTDDEITAQIGLVSTVKGALKKLAPIVNGWNEGMLNSEAHLHAEDGAHLSPVAEGAENLMDAEADVNPAQKEWVSVTMAGYVKGKYAYSAEAVQGKTRWFDVSKVEVTEDEGMITVFMSAKEAKKRGLTAA